MENTNTSNSSNTVNNNGKNWIDAFKLIIKLLAALGTFLTGLALIRKPKAEANANKQKNNDNLDYQQKKSNIEVDTYRRKKEADQKLRASREQNGNTGNCPFATANRKDTPVPNIPNARDLKTNNDHEPKPFIVPGFIQDDEFGAIFGQEKIGKTYLALQIARDAATGGKSSLFPEENCDLAKYNVLYYASEGYRDEIWTRLPKSFLEENVNFNLFPADHYNVYDLMSHINDQVKKVPKEMHTLLIIDNLSSFANNVYSGQVDYLMAELHKTKTEIKMNGSSLTVILFAHEKADGSNISSSAVVRQRVSTMIRFAEVSGKEGYRSLAITQSNLHRKNEFILKTVEIEGQPLTFEHHEPIQEEDELPGAEEEGEKNCKRDKAWWDAEMPHILEQIKAGKKQQEIAEEYGIRREYLNTKISQYKKEHPDKC